MESFKKKPTKRVALITGVAGAAVLGAVAIGGAAFADGPGAPSGSASAPAAAPSGAPSGAPAAPAAPGQQGGAPAAPGAEGPGARPAHQPHIGGEVLTVSGSTVTVKDHDGFTRTVQLSGDATVTKDGAKADASAITKGAHIEATGSVDSNGTTLDATEVRIGESAGPKGGPAGGPGAHGGPGRGGAEGGRQADGQAPTPPSGAPAAPQQGGEQQQPAPSASAPVQGS